MTAHPLRELKQEPAAFK